MNGTAALTLLLALTATAPPTGGGDLLLIDDFRRGLDTWKTKEFKGRTLYRIVSEDGKPALRADSDKAASGLVHERDIDLDHYPILNWSWKIGAVLEKGDARSKKGDDYAARVYVVFPGTFFWQTKALNYIWANRLPQGTVLANAYTASAMMIAVESGNTHAGEWRQEWRDVRADYRRAFGREPPAARAVAIMTDTDDTGGQATAWYGPIWFSPQPPAAGSAEDGHGRPAN